MQDILALATANLLSPAVLFFALGFFGTIAGSQLTLPEAVAKTLSIYLMLAIGFKGGVAVAEHGLGIDIALALIAGAVLSALIPLVAFALLTVMARLDQVDRAAVAAHYGSISIVTFVAGSEALRLVGLSFEGYLVAVAAVMETPAILMALFLAHAGRQPAKDSGKAHAKEEGLMSEVMLNSSVVVLIGSFVIGYLAGPKGLADIGPFIVDPFQGCAVPVPARYGRGRGPRHSLRLETHEPRTGRFRAGDALSRSGVRACRGAGDRAFHRRRGAADGAWRLCILYRGACGAPAGACPKHARRSI
jgi:hypothetical protein